MAPRGRKKKAGLMREDAARDAMRAFGFDERVISMCIKELLEVYGEENWILIEDSSYAVLLNRCLEMQDEQGKKLAEEKKELAEEQNKEIAEEEQEQTAQQEEEKEQEQQVVDGRDHVGSNSTSLGCGAETGTQTCQTDAVSITSETYILDSSPVAFPAGEASVIDYPSPVVFPSADVSGDYAQHSVGGAKNSGCGWLSEEETDPDEDSVGDSDEMIPLTPEPLCEELEELFREIRGGKKRKRVTRWDN